MNASYSYQIHRGFRLCDRISVYTSCLPALWPISDGPYKYQTSISESLIRFFTSSMASTASSRVSRTIGQEDPIGITGQDVCRRRAIRVDSQPAIPPPQASQYVSLDTEIYHRHIEWLSFRSRQKLISKRFQHGLFLTAASFIQSPLN